MKHLVIVICLTLSIAACQTPAQTPAADLIVTNARIYTMAEPAWAEAAVIRGKRFVFVGSADAAKAYAGADTRLVDLDGHMVLPGLIDAHLHPVDGAMKSLFQCNFPFSATPQEVQASVEKCAAGSSDSDWIIGGQWDSDFFVNHDVPSPRKLLDAVSGDKAVFLIADSGHDAWLNSMALALSGIDENSVDPPGGTIVRGDDGLPNGILLEKANYAARAVLPTWTEAQYLQGAAELMRIANGFGVTAMKDASAEESDLRGLVQLQTRGELTAHMAGALKSDKQDWGEDGQYSTERFVALREQYHGGLVDASHVKIFLDGVPTSSRTAAMLKKYLPTGDGAEAHDGGPMHYKVAQLTQMLKKLDAAGFTVKIHTAGDRSVQATLDAIEATRKSNGNSGLRFELAHAGFIAPEDIPRFKELNAVADLSPYLWHPSPIIDSVVNAVGPRGREYWPNRDLLDQGAPMLIGSDWPAAVESMNPWLGLEALVTRADPLDKTEGHFWPEQAITLHEALHLFTRDGARAMLMEQDIGAIQPGMLADFIVINHNLFDIAHEQISETNVLATYFAGKLVHQQAGVTLDLR